MVYFGCHLVNDQLKVWTLIIQKSTVIPLSLMVLFPLEMNQAQERRVLSTDELLLIIKSIFDILKYLPRDKRQDLAPYNCAAFFKAGCQLNNLFICLFLIPQAGWWFKNCFYVLLTATSVGPTEPEYHSPTIHHQHSPYLAWRQVDYLGHAFNEMGLAYGNWLKYGQAKLTLKLK